MIKQVLNSLRFGVQRRASLLGTPRFRTQILDGNWQKIYRSHLLQSHQNETRSAELEGALKHGASKLAIICGFTPNFVPRVSTKYLVEALIDAGYFVLQIQTGDQAQDVSDWPQPSGTYAYFLRNNIGYDFGSWFTGLALTQPWKRDVDEVLLINDSIIGPLFSLKDFLKDSHLNRYGLYGLSDSFEHSYHLQSFAVRLSGDFIRSPALDKFICQYPITTNKQVIIHMGEIALTQTALDFGFAVGCEMPFGSVRDKWMDRSQAYLEETLDACEKSGVSFKRMQELRRNFICARDLVASGASVNPTHYFWRTSFEEFRFPFLKRDLFLKNPVRIADWSLIPQVLENLSKTSQELLWSEIKGAGGYVPFVRPPKK